MESIDKSGQPGAAAKKPIVNCHAHIFTAEHVPSWLAKTFLPWPFYYLFPVSGVVRLFRQWYNGPGRWPYRSWFKALVARSYFLRAGVVRNKVLNILSTLAGGFLTLQVFFIVYRVVGGAIGSQGTKGWIQRIGKWLVDHDLLYPSIGWFWQLLLVLLLCVCFASGRNFLLFLFRLLLKLPGKQSTALAKRYINLGRFAFHGRQSTTFRQLKEQYPDDTRFVILPMDMEFMDAGKVATGYREQMQDLARLKAIHGDRFLPFVFVDPRRISAEPDLFNYSQVNGKIVLDPNCFIKEYIEDCKFSGFKIYPALGYYPFDERLLPLWKYAAENGIPIVTHCIRGNIFYRGTKKREWDHHPVFQEALGDGEYGPLLLPETKHIEWINNFTHPLNFLCLLDREFLAKLVGAAKDPRVKETFGYDAASGTIVYDLRELKICFGHFGGDEEWSRYFQLDRDLYTKELVIASNFGIDFTHDSKGQPSPGKPEQIWKNVDWFSIICSLMLQYPNVYSDISFILHEPGILPLLKRTLQPGNALRNRVLYGTDFYVVRNYKSDKNMLAEMMAVLTEEEFDLIARENPATFLI
jgi:predicted TIM-barrel fold metal-dependent hydrolase